MVIVGAGMAGTQSHVSVRNLTYVFRDGRQPLTALQDVSLDVGWGQFVSIIGPSGCGKSTLLRVIGGLLPAGDTAVLVGGQPPDKAQRAREIGLVAQDPALLPWRTALGNVRLPLEVVGARRVRFLPSPRELLELVGLIDFAEYYPHQLSGGMLQRVAIARTLAFDPSLLLMDEPFGALDEITRSSLRYELLRIWEAHRRDGGQPTPVAGPSGRKTVLFVTHSIAEAITMSDRVVVLTARPGRVRAEVDVELPRPRTPEIERTRAYMDYIEHLRDLLKEDGL